MGRRSTNVPASDGAISDAVPAPTSQQTASPEINDHPSSGVIPDPAPNEPLQTTDLSWTCAEPDANHPPPALLDHLSVDALAANQIPIALQNTYLSPSNASFAAVRWLGLLASDAARDSPQLATIPNSYANQNPPSGHFSADGLIQRSSLQYATQVLESPPASNASHDQTDSSTPGGVTLREKRIWQSRGPIELLEAEQTLFEYFVHQVSPWVGCSSHACDFDSLTIPSRRSIFLTPQVSSLHLLRI